MLIHGTPIKAGIAGLLLTGAGVHANIIEGEALPLQGKSRVQGMKHYGPDWRGDAHLLWDGKVGEAMTTTLDMPRAGRFQLKARITRAPDYGTFRVILNGKEIRSGVDGYDAKVRLGPLVDLGEVKLGKGPQQLVFKLSGAHAQARAFKDQRYLLGLDYLEITDLDTPDKPIQIAAAPKPTPKSPPEKSDGKTMPALKTLQPQLARHCHKCHGGEKTKGKVDLVALKRNEDLAENPELLEDLLAALRDRDMPPEDEPELPVKERETLIRDVSALLTHAIATRPFAPTPIRRMTRLQYNNAVVDLLELQRDIFFLPERPMRRRDDYFDPASGRMPDRVKVSNRPLGKDVDGQRPEGFKNVAAFPQDRRAEHGYDNRADHLTLSPLLMESFLKLSRSIVESPDLNPRESGAWKGLFEPSPPAGQEAQAVRERLPPLLRKAWRRTIEAAELAPYAAFAEKQAAAGQAFPEIMRTLVGAVLASPDFLYLYAQAEAEPSGTVRRQALSGFELATRLSFFLWNGLPDEALLDLAEQQKLSDLKTLEAQVDRMLNDRRMGRFCDSFPAQWLQLERAVSSIPEQKQFGYFYFNGYRLTMHMMMEPLLLFETVYLENRSVLDLIDPTFTWTSELLEQAYTGAAKGRRETQVLQFKRVPVPDRRFGGLITNAAVLTMTSAPDHTLPINRGAWINTVIFNDPPDPPPADVPPLPKPDTEALQKLTIRERFAEHRKREDCAGCHRQIDPLGFALENYGPTGLWRDRYANEREVDASGELFGTHRFDTPVDFKQVIRAERARFYRGFAAHLLSYGLGRGVSAADAPALDAIAAQAMLGQDRLRDLLRLVALSEPFRHKNTREPESGRKPHAP